MVRNAWSNSLRRRLIIASMMSARAPPGPSAAAASRSAIARSVAPVAIRLIPRLIRAEALLRIERDRLFEILGRLRELLVLHEGFAGQREERGIGCPGALVQDRLERGDRLRVLPLLHLRRRRGSCVRRRCADSSSSGRVQVFLRRFRMAERELRDAAQQRAGNVLRRDFQRPIDRFQRRLVVAGAKLEQRLEVHPHHVLGRDFAHRFQFACRFFVALGRDLEGRKVEARGGAARIDLDGLQEARSAPGPECPPAAACRP